MSELSDLENAERRRIAAGLVDMLALRDPETAAHLHAVGALSARLARRLGLSESLVSEIEVAASMHDIGKHLLPIDLIAKPSRLTADEWAQMKTHPELGARMLSGFASLASLARAVRWHHERVDGTGYPDGLSGDQIPLSSRVIAIADAFHAMTVARPYAQPRDPVGALDELARCAGTQFDHRIVAVFIDMMSAGRSHSRSRSKPRSSDVRSAI